MPEDPHHTRALLLALRIIAMIADAANKNGALLQSPMVIHELIITGEGDEDDDMEEAMRRPHTIH